MVAGDLPMKIVWLVLGGFRPPVPWIAIFCALFAGWRFFLAATLPKFFHNYEEGVITSAAWFMTRDHPLPLHALQFSPWEPGSLLMSAMLVPLHAIFGEHWLQHKALSLMMAAVGFGFFLAFVREAVSPAAWRVTAWLCILAPFPWMYLDTLLWGSHAESRAFLWMSFWFLQRWRLNASRTGEMTPAVFGWRRWLHNPTFAAAGAGLSLGFGTGFAYIMGAAAATQALIVSWYAPQRNFRARLPVWAAGLLAGWTPWLLVLVQAVNARNRSMADLVSDEALRNSLLSVYQYPADEVLSPQSVESITHRIRIAFGILRDDLEYTNGILGLSAIGQWMVLAGIIPAIAALAWRIIRKRGFAFNAPLAWTALYSVIMLLAFASARGEFTSNRYLVSLYFPLFLLTAMGWDVFGGEKRRWLPGFAAVLLWMSGHLAEVRYLSSQAARVWPVKQFEANNNRMFFTTIGANLQFNGALKISSPKPSYIQPDELSWVRIGQAFARANQCDLDLNSSAKMFECLGEEPFPDFPELGGRGIALYILLKIKPPLSNRLDFAESAAPRYQAAIVQRLSVREVVSHRMEQRGLDVKQRMDEVLKLDSAYHEQIAIGAGRGVAQMVSRVWWSADTLEEAAQHLRRKYKHVNPCLIYFGYGAEIYHQHKQAPDIVRWMMVPYAAHDAMWEGMAKEILLHDPDRLEQILAFFRNRAPDLHPKLLGGLYRQVPASGSKFVGRPACMEALRRY
ncbi:MAG: hypothetical protein GMKNLPBB_01247 [Myxococcota bacterium]|nr:hypothetical protein [Myxococcota bacterium]